MQRPPLGLVVVVAALSPISLVLAHNLVFLLAYGAEMGVFLRATGHDESWTHAVQFVVACSVALGAAGIARILVLWRTVRRLERLAGRLAHAGWRGFGGLLLRVWAGVGMVTTVWFLVQENVERLSIGEPAPLLGPLLGDGPIPAIVVIAAISLAAAIVGALFRWSLTSLLARISAARQIRRWLRPTPARRPTGRIAHPSALLARRLGLRAPPRVLVV